MANLLLILGDLLLLSLLLGRGLRDSCHDGVLLNACHFFFQVFKGSAQIAEPLDQWLHRGDNPIVLIGNIFAADDFINEII
jgi:hypothetical protein